MAEGQHQNVWSGVDSVAAVVEQQREAFPTLSSVKSIQQATEPILARESSRPFSLREDARRRDGCAGEGDPEGGA